MNQLYMKPHLIRASAGTGKTFRLSLEYIALLIRYRHSLSFDQIVVITFTRKAASEIRQRIISFLFGISSQPHENQDKIEILKEICPEISFNEEIKAYLQSVYREIVTNKTRLNISTLDSFINQIFKSLIAPYYNITEYDIDVNCNEKFLPQLYDVLLRDENIVWLQQIFNSTRNRNLSRYDLFISQILNERWLFEFYDSAEIPEINSIAKGEKALKELSITAAEFCRSLKDTILTDYADKPLDKIFPGEWLQMISPEDNDLKIDTALDNLEKLLTDEKFLSNKRSLLNSPANIWNGRSIFRGKKNEANKEYFTELQEELKLCWQRFLFYRLAAPEHNAIVQIARLLYNKYDEIKWREKVFTYSDLAFYSWKFFHNPDISIIDKHEVINLFYEQLAYRIRFILIDEFQDTSILQWNIFAPLINELIAGSGQNENSGTIIVGDEKQSIYAWRSGERDLLLNLPLILNHDFEISSLDTSYRSSKAVLKFVNHLFTDLFENSRLSDFYHWHYKKILGHKDVTGFCHFQITNLSGRSMNFAAAVDEFTTELIMPALQKGNISASDTAILCRTGNEVEQVCSVLRNNEIPYIDEGGKSILEHRAVKPLHYLLKWFNNYDFYHLVCFLRSDAVLLPSQELKQILQLYHTSLRSDSPFLKKLYNEFATLPVIGIIADLHKMRPLPLQLIKETLRQLNFIKVFNQETDFINIQKFVDLSASFIADSGDYPNNLAGLLQYFAENRFAENFAQEEIQQQNAIRVITIHKAKGLEFDTVILMQSSTSGSSNDSSLNAYPLFNSQYSALKDCFFTWNYDSLLPASESAPLYYLKDLKANIEAVNLWYVALTRAKRNLYSLFTFSSSKKEYWQEYINKDRVNINKFIINSVLEKFSSDKYETENKTVINLGKLEAYQSEEKTAAAADSPAGAPDAPAWYESIKETELVDQENWKLCLKSDALLAQTKARLTGNLAHYYLQHIEFDLPEQRDFALKKTVNYYGNLLHVTEIQEICRKINLFLEENHEFFSPAYWDVALREYVIFDKQQEFRLDRMLICHKRKEIAILDYKTGRIENTEQLSNYKNIVESIPYIKNNGYRVLAGRYLKVFPTEK